MSFLKTPLSRTKCKIFLAAYGICLVFSSILVLTAEINNVPDVYLPKNSEAVLLQNRMNKYFLPDEVIIAIFSGEGLYQPEGLEQLRNLVQSMAEHPLVTKVKAVTNQEKMVPTSDGFAIEALVLPESDNIPLIKERISSEKLAENLLFSKDLSTLAVVVFPLHTSNSTERLKLEDDFSSAVRDLGLSRYHQATGGLLPLDTAQLKALLSDISIYTPLTVLIGVLLIWFLYRRWLAVLALLISSNFVIVSSLACYGLFKQPVTSITGLLPTMLAALNTAMLIHFFRSAQRQAFVGVKGEARSFGAFIEVFKPSLLTCLTTAIGLMSLGLSEIPPIRYFGLFGGVGILASGL
ncbi:MAG: hypothetical protein KDD43_04950, partial [Bdellovibrionales bacterium]|nr:hypothetical protein [Bdellovibrionales bacterium]